MRLKRLALILLAAPAAAAQPFPADSTLPEVSVVATRVATGVGLEPSRVTRLDAEDKRATGARTMADLLEWRAPAQVRRNGPAGLATLSLRGAGSSQTIVLIDGYALTDPQLGIVDFSLLPALLVDRAEVLHGAGSALHGPGAMGGVVAIRTPAASDTRAVLETRVGSWGERGADALGSIRTGRFGIVLGASGTTAHDDFPHFDPNAGVSGGIVRREGADRALGSLFARVTTEGRAPLSVGAWVGSAERGVPGAIGTAGDQRGRQWDRHTRVWTSASLPVGRARLALGAALHRASLRFAGSASDDTGQTWLASIDAEVRDSLASWSVATGAGGSLATADHPSLAGDAREGRVSAWTAASGVVGPLALFPALRAEAHIRDAGTLLALSPRLGTSYSVFAGSTLKASAGTSFRPPTLNDRFWQYPGEPEPAGDPELRPERSWTFDAGALLRRFGLSVEATSYLAVTRDQIVWVPGEGGLFEPENLSRTVARGIEATAGIDPMDLGVLRAGGGLAYALTDARDRSDVASTAYNRQLRYVARHAGSAHAFVEATVGGTGVRLDLQGRLLGRRPTRPDGGAPLPAHAVADVRFSARRLVAGAGLEASLAIHNVTDAHYSVIEGYPMPPRHTTLSLRLTL